MLKNTLLDRILKEFNIKYTNIKKLNKGYASRKWIVTDIYNNTFILKESCIIATERVNYICYIQEQMKNISPKIYSSYNNKYVKMDQKIYILYEYIKGKQLTSSQINKDICYNIGKFMGKLHTSMKDVKEIKLKNEKNKIGLNLSKPNIDKMNRLINYYRNHDNCYEKILSDKLEIIKKINYSKLMKEVEKSLEKQVIHGDFYMDNIIFKNNDIYILDFEQTGIFFKLYEFFRGMFFVCYDETKEETENIENIKYFIKGYKEENYIENFDIAYKLYIYMLANSLTCLDEKSSEDTNCRKFAIYRYDILKWIISIKERLIEFFD